MNTKKIPLPILAFKAVSVDVPYLDKRAFSSFQIDGLEFITEAFLSQEKEIVRVGFTDAVDNSEFALILFKAETSDARIVEIHDRLVSRLNDIEQDFVGPDAFNFEAESEETP